MQSSLLTSEPTTKIDTRQRCEHCHVPEGSHHPISNHKVALAEIRISGKKQLLCSRCLIRAEIKAQTNPSYYQHSFMQTLKKLIHIIHHQYLLGSLTLIMFFVLVTLPTVILAQPVYRVHPTKLRSMADLGFWLLWVEDMLLKNFVIVTVDRGSSVPQDGLLYEASCIVELGLPESFRDE